MFFLGKEAVLTDMDLNKKCDQNLRESSLLCAKKLFLLVKTRTKSVCFCLVLLLYLFKNTGIVVVGQRGSSV